MSSFRVDLGAFDLKIRSPGETSPQADSDQMSRRSIP